MINLSRITFLVVIIFIITPLTAQAHARWVLDSVTPPRSNDTGLKTEPCGNIARTTRSTIFSAGQTIELEFEETVNHPGHYRIAFSPENDLFFDDVNNILVDNIPDTTNNGRYTQTITIPMQTCTACTLQLIQVMTTSTSPQPSDFYYSCTDIQITGVGDMTPPLTVSNVNSQAGDQSANLTWSNPVDDFYQVVVLKDITPISVTPANGTIYQPGDMLNGTEVVYVGNSNSFNVTSLANNRDY